MDFCLESHGEGVHPHCPGCFPWLGLDVRVPARGHHDGFSASSSSCGAILEDMRTSFLSSEMANPHQIEHSCSVAQGMWWWRDTSPDYEDMGVPDK